jgi:hypothetical protein
MEHIGTMLAISPLDSPYPGLAIVKDACTPTSLAEFAWDLFEAWMSAGAPVKEAWAFEALGHFGNDETAHRLTPFIREWPGESAHQRAVAGLNLLAAIGSDMARWPKRAHSPPTSWPIAWCPIWSSTPEAQCNWTSDRGSSVCASTARSSLVCRMHKAYA